MSFVCNKKIRKIVGLIIFDQKWSKVVSCMTKWSKVTTDHFSAQMHEEGVSLIFDLPFWKLKPSLQAILHLVNGWTLSLVIDLSHIHWSAFFGFLSFVKSQSSKHYIVFKANWLNIQFYLLSHSVQGTWAKYDTDRKLVTS